MDLATKDLRHRLKRFLFWFALLTLVMSGIILYTLMHTGISFFSISGNSMEPTLNNGDSVILKQEDTLRHNQIIFFNKPSSWSEYVDRNATLVKRVVAIPGDTLTYDGETFKVNNEIVYKLSDDNYECESGEIGYEHILTNTEVFATGDNANDSLDSRRIFCDGNSKDMYIPKFYVIDYGHIVKQF